MVVVVLVVVVVVMTLLLLSCRRCIRALVITIVVRRVCVVAYPARRPGNFYSGDDNYLSIGCYLPLL